MGGRRAEAAHAKHWLRDELPLILGSHPGETCARGGCVAVLLFMGGAIDAFGIFIFAGRVREASDGLAGGFQHDVGGGCFFAPGVGSVDDGALLGMEE